MSICKGCGKSIHWGRTKEGRTVPLDSIAPVYMFVVDDPSAATCTVDEATDVALELHETEVGLPGFALRGVLRQTVA